MRWFYSCPRCGKTYDIAPGTYLCQSCAAGQEADQPLQGVLECLWEAEEGDPEFQIAKNGITIPLPVEAKYFPSVPVGDTPLWAPGRLRKLLDAPGLFLKDDTCNPSGSFKDRASNLVAAFAIRHGIREIALASTGNAASSMACVGAAAGISVRVFLPAAAPAAKRIQVLQYGARLVEVQGTYDKAFDDSLEYTAKSKVLSRNTAYNPLTIEGKKTASFEIAKALGALRDTNSAKNALRSCATQKPDGTHLKTKYCSPGHVFVPTGDGVILSGIIKGFEDMLRLGLVDTMPVVWACQAEGSSALARALKTGKFTTIPSKTLADSISVDVPRNGAFALEKMKKYGGKAVTVTDEEILESQHLLASGSGLFAEPSSACAFASYLKVKHEIEKEESVIILLTGSGLKDIGHAALGVGARL